MIIVLYLAKNCHCRAGLAPAAVTHSGFADGGGKPPPYEVLRCRRMQAAFIWMQLASILIQKKKQKKK